jgi:cytochrome P450
LIRDLELVKNILVKDFQNFMDRTFSFDEKSDPLFGRSIAALNGQLWRHLRTKLTPVFTSRKIKMMFYLVDTCGEELADCLEKATADGKLPHDQLKKQNSPVTGLEWPRGFQEVKVPRFHDNGT